MVVSILSTIIKSQSSGFGRFKKRPESLQPFIGFKLDCQLLAK